MNLRQKMLSILVAAAALPVLQNCGVTQWQRDMDSLQVSVEGLHSAEMEKRITFQGEGK